MKVATFALFLAASPVFMVPILSAEGTTNIGPQGEELLTINNGTIKVGIDRAKGASITWLSWAGYPKNIVNIADPGRLIQQSYYAGLSLDRSADGQSNDWKPWSWNPIQGGGVSSWARVNEFKKIGGTTLYGETIPKLWDMPDEEAAALMRQWTGFEPSMSNVIVVRCELVCSRTEPDRWGPPKPAHQEIAACYYTRNFNQVKSYLGDGKWRDEVQAIGPPWGRVNPPRKALACFEPGGQGVAIFSPASTIDWNFGPHGEGSSDDPKAAPCMHVAPLDLAAIGAKSNYSFRYWLVVGTEAEIAERLDALWKSYASECSVLRDSK